MAKYNVHAGHNPDGKKACGAVGLIKESTEARKVKNLVIKYLKAQGHTVYDCTVNDGTSASNVLTKIVSKCNAHKVDLDVSIHFNSGVGDKKGNGKTTGTEVLIYSNSSRSKDEATKISAEISKLGFKNRGVKLRPELYFLKKTNAPALLIEVCFVDDLDDVSLYQANIDKVARAIVKGITGKDVVTETKKETTFKSYKVKITADILNVREKASTSTKIVTKVKKGKVYTIVEKSNGWGKLKSGVGWIKLSYTKKV